ncbi:MAG: pyrroline-5-carboxylate reductase [Lachnospiraceae bacterium]|nr:pyrroline-5-carboxylate reductase [Lachnospiraceae bacterium]
MKKIGFIGAGNMASAIMGGIIKKGIFMPMDILASDMSEAAREKAHDTLGICVTADNREVVTQSEIVVFAVKPQFYASVFEQVKDLVREEQIVLTIAPGWTLEKIEEHLGKPHKIIRTMPNTPALVGEGITGVCHNSLVTAEDIDKIMTILGSFGRAELIGEHLMDTVVSVSGSSPAYVFMMIEAMADAAVADGMPRQQAYTFAAQAVYGSAKMVLETGKHPGELKDMVCSPAGTTIEAVGVLEKKGFRSAIFECMRACVRKARGM